MSASGREQPYSIQMRLLLLAFLTLVTNAWSQGVADVADAARKAEQQLGNERWGYRCSEFVPTNTAPAELRKAADDARARGDFAVQCAPYLKPVQQNERFIGMRDGGLVIVITKQGLLQQPYWSY